MDRRCVVLLALVVGLGCNPEEEARRKAVENNLNQLEIAIRNYEQHQGPSVDRIVDGGNQFAIDLYQQLRSTDGNLFFSPSSISTALAMAYAGAAGQTATEMATTLHFPTSSDELQSGMETLQTLWFTSDEKSGIRLRLANRLWGQQGCEFSARFLAIFELASTLSALGMPSAFDASTADFSGMTGGKDVYFSAVLHKAFVDVSEEGTEAAAATGMVAVTSETMPREPQPPPVFRADHPFLFLIRDHRTGAILFLGRLIDPLK